MRYLVFDTETTGLLSNSLRPLHMQPRVIEFFGLVLDSDKDYDEVGQLHFVVDPQRRIEPIITKITGFTDEKVKGKPLFVDQAEELHDLLLEVDAIVGHNPMFDMAMVEFEFMRLSIAQLADLQVHHVSMLWPDIKICTGEQSEHLFGYVPTLSALHTHLFGEGFAKAHSAEADVRATARCFIELVKRGII